MTTQTNLETYVFEHQEVRMIELNNEPWFVGKDVADILGYSDLDKAVRQHVDELDKQTLKYRASAKTAPSLWKGNDYSHKTLINESGLYALIFGSKLPAAKQFKRWVTSVVLPSIRKHGAYMNAETIEKALTDPDTIIRLATTLKEEREERMLLEQQIAEYEPKISYLDTILSSTDTVTITQIAADYGMSGQKLNKILNELNVQHKVGGQWILYRKHMQQGYTKSHTSEIPKADGGIKVVMNTKWTQKGRLFLYNLLKDEGYLPQMELDNSF